MATTKTPLGLNQWELDEKLKMDDFNSDNQIVDGKLQEVDGKIGHVEQKLDGEVGRVDQRIAAVDSQLNTQLAEVRSDIAQANTTLADGMIYPATATYSSGIFTLQGLPATVPDVFTVRFIAPEDYTYGDMLHTGAAPLQVATLDGNAPVTGAFKAGVVVSMDIHSTGGRAFFNQGGGSGGYGILPSQTQIEVEPDDACANVSLFNLGGPAYAGTKLVCKQGEGMPQTQTDGQVHDAGQSSSYAITGLTNDIPYTVRAFAYNSNGDVQTDINGAVKSFVPAQGAALGALGDLPVGSVVKLNVNGAAREFLIVHHGRPSSIYDNGWANATILLINDVLEARQWHTSDVNNYRASDIHQFLTQTFVPMLDSKALNALLLLKVPYASTAGPSPAISSGAGGLPTKAFLLSGREIGLVLNVIPDDGVLLDYFIQSNNTSDSEAQTRRNAYMNGVLTHWWTRTPNINVSQNVRSSLASASYRCTLSHGVRPAIAFASTTKVGDDGTLVFN